MTLNFKYNLKGPKEKRFHDLKSEERKKPCHLFCHFKTQGPANKILHMSIVAPPSTMR